MSAPETTQDIAIHLRRMADNAGDQIDADRLSIAANLVDRAHLVAPDAPPDGGPAYPVMWDYAEGETGMSLRDWFAGQKIVGDDGLSMDLARALMGGNCPDNRMPVLERAKWWMLAEAKYKYLHADSMIAARGGNDT